MLNRASRPFPDHAVSAAVFIGSDPDPKPGHEVIRYRAPIGDTSDRVTLPPLRAGADVNSDWTEEVSLVAKNQPGPTSLQGICARVPTCPAARPTGDASAGEPSVVGLAFAGLVEGAFVAAAPAGELAAGELAADEPAEDVAAFASADEATTDSAAAGDAGVDGEIATGDPLPLQAATRTPTSRTPIVDLRAVGRASRILTPTSLTSFAPKPTRPGTGTYRR